MTMHSITKGLALVASRLPAFVAGCIFVACAAATLFEDVMLHGASITLPHVLTLGVLSGTLLVGHLLLEACREWRVLSAIGFAVLFGVGTGLIVYLSTGKQAEHTFQSQAEADFAAEERARIKPLLKIEQDRKSKTQDKLQADCVDGRKGKLHCDGLRTTLGVYTMAVRGYEAELAKYGIQKPVAPEAESFANIAAVFGFDKAKVKAGAILVVPFIRTILFELGGLWCLGFAFRPLPRSVSKPATQKPATRQPSATETMQTSFHADDIEATRATILGGPSVAETPRNALPFARRNPGNRGNGGNPAPKRPNPVKPGGNREAFEADVLTRLALGQTIESQDELAAAHGVHKGVASKWLKDMRERGLIPAAQRVGRCHRLVAAE